MQYAHARSHKFTEALTCGREGCEVNWFEQQHNPAQCNGGFTPPEMPINRDLQSDLAFWRHYEKIKHKGIGIRALGIIYSMNRRQADACIKRVRYWMERKGGDPYAAQGGE